MDGLVIRNDDVSSNTGELKQVYDVINSKLDCTILSCTTVLSKNAFSGAVYPDLPLIDKPIEYFFDVDAAKYYGSGIEEDYDNLIVASHGLWHFDHTKVDSQLKKASIISSCRLLEADIFVPPFNKWDEEMELICTSNGIQMIKSQDEGWKSFEHNKFDPTHKLWYFHSWRWDSQRLKEYLSV